MAEIAKRGVNSVCADMLRSAIVAAPGNELTCADWSNIESRVLAWIADEEWKLAAYRAQDRKEGVDLYRLLFSNFFGTPVKEVTDHQRQSGKVAELAFGFGGGVGAMVTMAAGYEMDLDPLAALILPHAKEEHLKKARRSWRRAFLRNEDYGLEPSTYQACDVLKQVYRESNERIDTIRHQVDDATKSAVKNHGTLFEVAKCKIWCTGAWLIIELPSGRRLLYAVPRIDYKKEVDPETGKTKVYESIGYMTARNRTWMWESSWSGLFVENIVQAVAADVLRAALIHIHTTTFANANVYHYLQSLPPEQRTAISLHVHDEVVLDLPKGYVTLPQLLQMMTTDLLAKHQWLRGMPLAAAGWVGPRYHK